jgi:hypothetical protein
LTGAVTGAVGAASNLVSGAATITNGAGVAGGISNLTSITSKSMSGVAGASALASGISNLSGGQNAIASITNAASSVASMVPGVSGIGDMAKTLSTAAQNGINPGAALGSTITSLTAGAGGAATDLLNKAGGGAGGALAGALAAGKDKLSSLASAGLPPGLASQLASNINSLNTAGADPIKMPSIGLGTVDRSELTASIGSVLGDKKITAPNFSGEISSDVAAAASAQADKVSSILTQVSDLQKQSDDQYAVYATARDALYTAIDNLPEGDPAIATARAAASTEYKKLVAISEQKSALLSQA